MKKKEIIELLKEKCHDFLNATGDGKHTIGDITLKGFYIEVEDVADILYPLLKDTKKSNKQIYVLRIYKDDETREFKESDDI